MAKDWPCKLKDGSVKPCHALAAVVDGNWMEKRKGIFVATIINRGDDTQRYLYGVRSGDHTKKGVMFNHCPFCGESILPDAAAKLGAKAA